VVKTSSSDDLLPKIKIPPHVQQSMKHNEIQFYNIMQKYHYRELKNIRRGSIIWFSIIALIIAYYCLSKDEHNVEESLLYFIEQFKNLELSDDVLINLSKWLKANSRDGIELLEKNACIDLIIQYLTRETKRYIEHGGANSVTLSELLSITYMLLKNDQLENKTLLTNHMGTILDALKQLTADGFQFEINYVDYKQYTMEQLIENDELINKISHHTRALSNMLRLYLSTGLDMNRNDLEKTIQNLTERNDLLEQAQNHFEERLSVAIQKIERGEQITENEKSYMKRIENKFENPNAVSESFFIASLIAHLVERGSLSDEDIKSSPVILNFLRKEFKGNNHLSYIPSGYVLVHCNDISQDSIFKTRLSYRLEERDMNLKMLMLRTRMIEMQQDVFILDRLDFKKELVDFKQDVKGTYLEPFLDYFIKSQFGFVGEVELMKQELLLFEAINHESQCGPRDVNLLFELGNTLLQRNDLDKSFQILTQIQIQFPFYTPIRGVLAGICRPSNLPVLRSSPFLTSQILSMDKWDQCYKLRLTLQKENME